MGGGIIDSYESLAGGGVSSSTREDSGDIYSTIGYWRFRGRVEILLTSSY